MKLEDHSNEFQNAIFKMVYKKKYSDKSKYQRILSAIVEGTVDKLDKNLKILANKVTAINKNQ